MDRQKLINSIAFCGLICGRCHLKAKCDFCRNSGSLCERSEVCYQRNCCIQRGLQGCWECDNFPCGEDMHSNSHDLRIRAFVSFIKNEGKDSLIDCLLRNEEHGIFYGQGRDYDGKGSEEEVIQLLKAGSSS